MAAPTVLQTFPSPPETHAHRRVAVATLRVRGPLRLPARREAPHLVTQNPASRPRRWAGAFAPSRHVCVTSVPASQEWWDPAPIRKNARPLCVTVRPRCMDLAKRPDAQSRPCPWRTLAPLPVRGSPGARASRIAREARRVKGARSTAEKYGAVVRFQRRRRRGSEAAILSRTRRNRTSPSCIHFNRVPCLPG